MATIKPTNLADILLAIQARLVAVLGWRAERVVIDARGDGDHEVPTVQADQYIRLQVGSRNPDGGTFEARGRIDPWCNAAIRVQVRGRLDLDPANSDELALTHASLGLLRLEGRVWDALAIFQPVDADGNWLVKEPIKPRPATDPRKPPKGWIQSVLAFNVTFVMDLDQSYQ